MCIPVQVIADFTGPVVSVLDGDTIEVLYNTHPELIRLSGIDCPEKGQAFGNRAQQAASALVLGRDVMLDTHGQDKLGRTLADVTLRDGTNVNHELVKEGWCWWDRPYAPAASLLEKLEKDARAGKKGLWVDPHSRSRRGSGGGNATERRKAGRPRPHFPFPPPCLNLDE